MIGGECVEIANLILFVAYIMEPCAWLYSMCLRFERKYKCFYPYMGYIVLDVCVTGIKELTRAGNVLGEMFFTFLSLGYVLLVVYILFAARFRDKLLHVAILFLLSLCGDALSLGALTIMGYPLNELSEPGLSNSIATLLSKVILFVMIRFVFSKANKLDYDMLPSFLVTLVMELPSVVLFNEMKLINNNGWFLLAFIFSPLGVLFIVIFMKMKKKREEELLVLMRDMKMQLKGSEGAEETLENLRILRHDMKQHIGVIKYMLSEGKYNDAKLYLDKVYKDVDVASEYYTLKNRSVSITLTMLKQLANLKQVNFYTKIMTENFCIDDVEICTVISNIGRNAIEAAERTEDKYCKIIIYGQNGGCRIECENTYNGELRVKRNDYQTTKGEGHGYGIKIITKIIKKNNGKVSFRGKNNTFLVDAFIPGGDCDCYDEGDNL